MKDSTFKADGKINHRRCLNTYINQHNPWNFTDWRYFIEQKSDYQIKLYYQESRQPGTGQTREETVQYYSLNGQLTRNDIEIKIKEWVVKKYHLSAQLLLDKIIFGLESVLQKLKSTLII